MLLRLEEGEEGVRAFFWAVEGGARAGSSTWTSLAGAAAADAAAGDSGEDGAISQIICVLGRALIGRVVGRGPRTADRRVVEGS